MSTSKLLILGALVILSACSDTATTPEDVQPVVVLSASGSGLAAVTMPGQPANSTQDPFSFTANTNADGPTEGEVTVKNVAFAPVEQRKGAVTCMARVGNAGIVMIGADIPAEVAGPDVDHAYFFSMFVRDNGDGTSSPPDQILFGYQALPNEIRPNKVCDAIANFESSNPGALTSDLEAFFSDVTEGQIQVSP